MSGTPALFSSYISIHAPVKGATHPYPRILESGPHFNPRSREGSDVRHVIGIPIVILFQSTLP